MKKLFLLGAVFALSLVGCNSGNTVSTKPTGKKVTKEEFFEATKNYKYADIDAIFTGKAKYNGFYKMSRLCDNKSYTEYDAIESLEGTATIQYKDNTSTVLEKDIKYSHTVGGQEQEQSEENRDAYLLENCSCGYFGTKTIAALASLDNDPYVASRGIEFQYYLNPAQVLYESIADENNYSKSLWTYNKDGLVTSSNYESKREDKSRMDDGTKVTYKYELKFRVTTQYA